MDLSRVSTQSSSSTIPSLRALVITTLNLDMTDVSTQSTIHFPPRTTEALPSTRIPATEIHFTSGDVALDFLLGIPFTYGQGSGAPINAYAFLNYLFAQDTWKATSSLTFSYGIGYQIDTPLHNTQFKSIGVTCYIPGEQSKVFPTAPKNLNYPGDPGCNNASGATTRYSDFGPRLGIAWAPDLGILSDGASHKLSIRAGFGIYYNRTEEETSLNNLEDPPFGVSSHGVNDYNQTTTPGFANPYQDVDTPARPEFIQISSPLLRQRLDRIRISQTLSPSASASTELGSGHPTRRTFR